MKPAIPTADTYLKDFCPAWAVVCWADDSFVYTLIPTKSGPPLIQKHSLTEGGMTKAISVLRVQKKVQGAGRVHKPSSPVVTTKLQKPSPLSEEGRQKTLSVLRRMGLVPNA